MDHRTEADIRKELREFGWKLTQSQYDPPVEFEKYFHENIEDLFA